MLDMELDDHGYRPEEQRTNKLIHTENKMVVTRGEGDLEEDEKEREGQTHGGRMRGIFKW